MIWDGRRTDLEMTVEESHLEVGTDGESDLEMGTEEKPGSRIMTFAISNGGPHKIMPRLSPGYPALVAG
jgi:hypothetical protein